MAMCKNPFFTKFFGMAEGLSAKRHGLRSVPANALCRFFCRSTRRGAGRAKQAVPHCTAGRANAQNVPGNAPPSASTFWPVM